MRKDWFSLPQESSPATATGLRGRRQRVADPFLCIVAPQALQNRGNWFPSRTSRGALVWRSCCLMALFSAVRIQFGQHDCARARRGDRPLSSGRFHLQTNGS